MIIFLSGAINSGKSTVAKILAEKLGNTAIIEVDALRDFIEWMPLAETIPINLENTCTLIRNFVNHHLNVVIPYPISRKNHDFVMERLRGLENDIHFFILNPALDASLKNRGSRSLTEWETERIKHHYSIGLNAPDFGTVLDNTSELPEETAQRILMELQK